MRVADQRALHVVNAETVNHPVLLPPHAACNRCPVRNSSSPVFEVSMWPLNIRFFPPPDPSPARDHIRAAFLDLLPGHVESQLLKRGPHVLRHLQFLAGRARNVDDIAAIATISSSSPRRGFVCHARDCIVRAFSPAFVTVNLCSRLTRYSATVRQDGNHLDRCIASRCHLSVIRKLSSSRKPSAAGPVNSRLDRQYHPLLHRPLPAWWA